MSPRIVIFWGVSFVWLYIAWCLLANGDCFCVILHSLFEIHIKKPLSSFHYLYFLKVYMKQLMAWYGTNPYMRSYYMLLTSYLFLFPRKTIPGFKVPFLVIFFLYAYSKSSHCLCSLSLSIDSNHVHCK